VLVVQCALWLPGIGGERDLELLQSEALCNCRRPCQGNQQLPGLAQHSQVLSVLNHKAPALITLRSVCHPCQHHSLERDLPQGVAIAACIGHMGSGVVHMCRPNSGRVIIQGELRASPGRFHKPQAP